MVETIRGLVRPFVTVLVVVTFVAMVIYLVVKFGDAEMMKTAAAAFLILVSMVSGFWFASRSNGRTPGAGAGGGPASP